jgi:hypothetical protein
MLLAVRDGLVNGADAAAQTFSTTLEANWDAVVGAAPLYRADAKVVVADRHGRFLDLPGVPAGEQWTTSLATNSTYGFTGLNLTQGSTYAVCVRVVDIAGLVSNTACSDGVVVGRASVPMAENDTTSVMLSPSFPASMLVDSESNDTGSGRKRSDTFMAVQVPPGAVGDASGGARRLSGSAARTFESRQLSGEDLPPTNFSPDYKFGDQAFAMEVAGSGGSFVFEKPIRVSLIYAASANAAEASAVAPSLRLYENGTWVPAANTCLPPYGTGPVSMYDPVSRVYEVEVCHFRCVWCGGCGGGVGGGGGVPLLGHPSAHALACARTTSSPPPSPSRTRLGRLPLCAVCACAFGSTYGFFFQPSPVAIISAPAAVQIADAAVIAVDGSGSYDRPSGPVVSYAWTVTNGSGDALDSSAISPANGLTASSFSLVGLPAGTYNISLKVGRVCVCVCPGCAIPCRLGRGGAWGGVPRAPRSHHTCFPAHAHTHTLLYRPSC